MKITGRIALLFNNIIIILDGFQENNGIYKTLYIISAIIFLS